MSGRPAPLPPPAWSKQLRTVGELYVCKCICLLSRASARGCFLRWRKRRKGEGEEKTFGSEIQGKWLCKQGSLCCREESARPGRPDARLAVLSLPGCVHTSAALIGTQTLSFSLAHSPRYFKQNTSNFLFLKLSCISSGIPSNPGERQGKPTQQD